MVELEPLIRILGSSPLKLCGLAGGSLVATTLLVMLYFAAWVPAMARCFNWCRCAGRSPQPWPDP